MSFDFFYVARQPIVDRDRRTFGYELLFRSGRDEARALISDGDQATVNVVTCGFIKGQENVDKLKRIFINFTGNLILSGAPRALPSANVVIEILEDIEPTDGIISELLKLKQEGYLIAIDDFRGNFGYMRLLDIADIIKVDVFGKCNDEVVAIYSKLKNNKALKLAEKVETKKSFHFLKELGFDLFQGFFFARPENLTGKKPRSFMAGKIRVLSALNNPNNEISELVEVVEKDPSITYRLLRLINSAAFGFSMKIESVRHAVVLLGSSRIRYWLRMVVLSDINAANNPEELMLLALSRGKFLEELAYEGLIQSAKPETMFLYGMLSLLDVMLDMPFTSIVTNLPLPDNFEQGYLDSGSPWGKYIKLFFALENDDRLEFIRLCQELVWKPQLVIEASIRASLWSNSIAQSIL